MPRPNILWIQSDEQRPDSLGCYGSSWAKTPHLDALAARGIVYHNCVCNSPVCVPSRASQLAARYPQELNCLHNECAGLEGIFPAGTLTFPELLAREGYACASFGKAHTPRWPIWQEHTTFVNLDEYAGYYALNPAYDEAAQHVIKRPGSSPVILAGTYPVAAGHPSQLTTDAALNWLRRHDRRVPFLLRISHNWPHTPVLPPPPWDALYAGRALPVRLYDEQAYRSRSRYDRAIADRQRVRELSPDQMRQVWKDYMGLCACVDNEVGRALCVLDELGLTKDTIVLYSADHGKGLGEWGATEKGFYDRQVWQVPFILAGPGVPTRPGGEEDLCELIDTARTLCALAGIEPAAAWRGRDLLHSPAPEAVFGQIGWPSHRAPLWQRLAALPPVVFPPGNPDARIWAEFTARQQAAPHAPALMRCAIRTVRYRLDASTWYDDAPATQAQADGNLFDLEADPYERHNLWAEPASQGVVRELWDRLQAWSASLDVHQELFGAPEGGCQPLV